MVHKGLWIDEWVMNLWEWNTKWGWKGEERWEGLLACERCVRRGVLHISFTAAGSESSVRVKEWTNKQTLVSFCASSDKHLQSHCRRSPGLFCVLMLLMLSTLTCWHDRIQRGDTCFRQRSRLLWCHCRPPQLHATQIEEKRWEKIEIKQNNKKNWNLLY